MQPVRRAEFLRGTMTMSTLIEQIEAMRIRMNELAAEEPGFVRSLGDALADADERHLDEVRSVAAAYGTKRGIMAKALQMLAGRVCALYRPRRPLTTFEDTADLAMRGADWRRAAANIQEV